MSALTAVIIILGYFLVLITISYFTGKDDSNEAFFSGNRNSPWYIVAFGMIGASLSGVTFISVPGWVATKQFSYMEVVAGYFFGYLLIANVLLPLYYRMNLTSIYGYLETRFGFWSYKTGAFFFLLSRVIGSAFRLYIVAMVMHLAIFEELGWPFWLSVLLSVSLIWVYTFRSGIKTIIWTDTFQTAALLLAVVVTIFSIRDALDWTNAQMISSIRDSEYSQWLFLDDWKDPRHFVKQFLAGMFITITMTGLDQDMMQKNLTCRNLGDAKKNMFWFSLVLIVANLLFLSLGAMLYIYAHSIGLDSISGDQLYPTLALDGHLGTLAGVLFLVGLVAAAYSSADSALTALTTSFCVDFLNMAKSVQANDKKRRMLVHVAFTLLLALVIIVFEMLNNDSVIQSVFEVAGYTYGPLLGLYAFGMFTKVKVIDSVVPIVCVLSPVLSFGLKFLTNKYFGYQIGFELLLINGMITMLGLWLAAIFRKTDPMPA